MATVILVISFSGYYSYAFYQKDKMLFQLTKNTRTLQLDVFLSRTQTLLSYHREIGTDEVLIALYPLVQDYVSEPQADGGVKQHETVSIMEKNEPDTPRTLLQLGGAYFSLWADYGNNEDYEEGVEYFNRVQKARPGDPYSLFCLYTMYMNYGDARTTEIKRRIEQNGYGIPQNNSCSIPSGF